MSLKKKIKTGMELYINTKLLPCTYELAVKCGFVGDYEDYQKEVLEKLKEQSEVTL